MNLLKHSALTTHRLPGLTHQTLANLDSGTYTLEVWRQSLAPGSETPWHSHACEEVIVVLAGRGEYRTRAGTVEFGPECTLIVKADVQHQLANTGDEPLELLAALGITPVTVLDAEGRHLPLPWDARASAEMAAAIEQA